MVPGDRFFTAGPQSAMPLDREQDRRRRFRLIASLLLVLSTIALYNPVSHDPYLTLDDNAYTYENFHVRTGLTWDTAAWAFTTTEMSNWHPLTWLSHALDVELFGLNPAGPHYVNLLLHAANVVLLFLLLASATGLEWPSVTVASLFALHPLNVESVAWIAERKNGLSMLFFLLALAAYGRYVRKPGVARYLLVFLLFACALMSKPQVITLPFALLLLDYWPLARSRNSEKQGNLGNWPWLTVEKLPLLALSAASAWITMHTQTGAMHIEYPLSVRAENAAISYLEYISKVFWPSGLAPLYPHPGFAVSTSHAVLAVLVLAVITALTLRSKRRYLVVGWLWFLGILVPMIGLIQVGVQARADRYMYIPGIGLFVMVCWGASDLFEFLPPAVSRGMAAALLAAVVFASHRQIALWKDNVTLWTYTLAVTRNNFIAEDNLGDALISQGRLDEAAGHFENAVRINPYDPLGNLNLATYELQRQNYASAMTRYKAEFTLTQNSRLLAMAHANMGYAYYHERDLGAARQSFHAALRLQPQNPRALIGVGLVDQMSGDLAQAAEDYRNALHLEQNDVGYLLLAQVLERAGRVNEANSARAAARRISPNLDAASQSVQQLLSP
jgi:protein O-mannosyl-transferase